MPCSIEHSCEVLRRAANYQIVLPNGSTKRLSNMDSYEMMEALMSTVDTVERVDARLGRLSYLIDEWQMKGTSKPQKKSKGRNK